MATAKTGRARKGSPATMRFRLVKCPECGCKARVARVWLVRCAELGRRPSCVACGAEASCPDVLDAALYDDRAVQAIGDTAWRDQYTPVIRDGQVRDRGFQPRSENARKRVPRHRCEHRLPSGKTCPKWPTKGKRYCDTHDPEGMPF